MQAAGAYPYSIGTPTPRRGCSGERREAGIQWIQPPKAVSDPEFRQTTSGAHGSAGRADCLPRGKPPACINGQQLCRKQFPLTGIDAPTPAREKGLQPSWGTHLLRRRSEEGAGGRAESHPASMTRDSFAVRNSPLRGPDAPTPARIGTCRPKEHSHFSFGGERKVCKRKPAAQRLREKASIAHFDGGARYVARSGVGQIPYAIVRARSSPFSAVKMGGPFSLRCLSPLCSPAVGGGQAYPLRVEMES